MPTSVTMPRLGESVTEGTVTRWLKAEGDQVEVDEPLLEVSTDKVDTEVPSPASGTLLAIKVGEDETVEIGVELAVIGEAAEDAGGDGGSAPASEAGSAPASADEHAAAPEPEPAQQAAPEPEPEPEPEPARVESKPRPAPAPASAPAATTGQAPAPAAAPARSSATATAPDTTAPDTTHPNTTHPNTTAREATQSADGDEEAVGTYVTPLVRKLAAEHGIDLSSVEGTGVGGRIRKSDVLAAADKASQEAAAPPPAAVTAAATAPAAPAATPAPSAKRGKMEPMSRMRQVIATRMVESLQTSAQLTTVVEVDVTKIARLREAAKRDFEAREGVKLSFLPFFAVAAIEALKVHPQLNASIDMDAKTITYHDAEHLGIAVDTERGLLVPVIHNAGDLNLAGLARKIADLAERTRANKVSPDELGGGTFTLTNTGSRGALFDTPIINQPQVGILGTGAVVKRPVVVSSPELGETIAIRSMVYLALTYDHRIVDGADAARFLVTIKDRLEAGAFERALGLA
jgi:pyruvate dehydrogenase E2 component (dihydrolipoamide acetyltransferase)